MLRCAHNFLRRVGIAIRLVKPTLPEFHPQDVPHSRINRGFGQFSFQNELSKRYDVLLRHREVRADIQPRLNRLPDALGVIRRHPMLAMYELHRLAIRNHITLEAPFMAQDVREELPAAGDWNAVVIVVRTHDAHRPRLADSATERIQKHRLHFAPRYGWIGAGLAVATALRHAVNGEVFER